MNASRLTVLVALGFVAVACVHDGGSTRQAPAAAAPPPAEFRDCPDCPAMVRIPPGRFQMGSPPEETAGRGWPPQTGGNERPVHEVVIGREFALGRTEVTRGQFAAFVAETGHDTSGGCLDFNGGFVNVKMNPQASWRNPGFEQTDDQPALCLSWQDAQAYVTWLAAKTGQPYRLPSEAEWEYAARAGTTTIFPWGEDPSLACEYGNARAKRAWQPKSPGDEAPYPCDDGHDQAAPVGSFKPNAFGLYDMVGNVFEWTEDCNHTGYAGAPADGSAWVDDPGCVFRIMRGGSFANSQRQTRSAARVGRPVSGRAPMLGFRVARSLGGAPAARTAGVPAVKAVTVAGGDDRVAALFAQRCAACHVDGRSFRGVYGRDQETVERVIREGGANNMSMPGWSAVLSAGEIRDLASYVRRAAGWE